MPLTTSTVKVGDLVSYEDQANPRRVYRVLQTERPPVEFYLEAVDHDESLFSDLRQYGWNPVVEAVDHCHAPVGPEDNCGEPATSVDVHDQDPTCADHSAEALCEMYVEWRGANWLPLDRRLVRGAQALTFTTGAVDVARDLEQTLGGFVPRIKAHQHLNRDGKRTTLCGVDFEDMHRENAVYDHRDGFDPKGGPKCAPCADAADAIQNGGR